MTVSQSVPSPSRLAAQEPFLPVLRELARTYQAFSLYSERHIRTLDLTPPQFDVIVTLGNTEGLCMRELAEKTLVTKGTLTGIVDRLEAKGLVRREVPEDNRRSFTIVLTEAGDRLFQEIFPIQIAHLKQRLGHLTPAELTEIKAALSKLRKLF